jgi:hypothetical protein
MKGTIERARVADYQFKQDSDQEDEEGKTSGGTTPTPDKPTEAEISEMEK